MKHCNLYLGLVLPSGGWQSLIMVRIQVWLFHPFFQDLKNQAKSKIDNFFCVNIKFRNQISTI